MEMKQEYFQSLDYIVRTIDENMESYKKIDNTVDSILRIKDKYQKLEDLMEASSKKDFQKNTVDILTLLDSEIGQLTEEQLNQFRNVTEKNYQNYEYFKTNFNYDLGTDCIVFNGIISIGFCIDSTWNPSQHSNKEEKLNQLIFGSTGFHKVFVIDRIYFILRIINKDYKFFQFVQKIQP